MAHNPGRGGSEKDEEAEEELEGSTMPSLRSDLNRLCNTSTARIPRQHDGGGSMVL